MSKTALLVMDIQPSITNRYPEASQTIGHINQAINHAHTKGLMVIYVAVGFRNGMPEVAATNKTFSASKAQTGDRDISGMTQLHPELTVPADAVTVIKRRFSAFTGSDLEVILRANNIGHLVLTGISTSGVVLSTLREASDKDYTLTVLSDGCLDRDEEVHRVLTTKVFLMQAEVMTVGEWTNQ